MYQDTGITLIFTQVYNLVPGTYKKQIYIVLRGTTCSSYNDASVKSFLSQPFRINGVYRVWDWDDDDPW